MIIAGALFVLAVVVFLVVPWLAPILLWQALMADGFIILGAAAIAAICQPLESLL